MKKNIFYLSLILLSLSFRSAGTSYLGGQITWTCIGQDSFMITLTVYRDCNGGPMMPATVGISCAMSNNFSDSIRMSVPSPIDVTPFCGCSRCSYPSCSLPYGFEEYTFTGLLTTDPVQTCCLLRLSFSDCCRSDQIFTIKPNQGFYLESIFNHCLSPSDNSPVFSNTPLKVVCLSNEVEFRDYYYDTDMGTHGELLDSFAFEWPAPKASDGNNVVYENQYSSQHPVYFWGFPNESLSFPRGIQMSTLFPMMAFTPLKVENFMVSLHTLEYRNNILIGEITRDISIFVINCPTNHAPVLSGPFYKEVLPGNQVQFSINTNDYDVQDSLRVVWNQAIPNANWTDNNNQIRHPTGVLTWQPTAQDVSVFPYVFTATVTDNSCPVHATTTRLYQILVIDTVNALQFEPVPLKGITLIPNPATDKLQVNYQNLLATIKSYSLYNLLGKLCSYNDKVYANQFELNRDRLPAGVYILKVTDTKGRSGNYKVVFKD